MPCIGVDLMTWRQSSLRINSQAHSELLSQSSLIKPNIDAGRQDLVLSIRFQLLSVQCIRIVE